MPHIRRLAALTAVTAVMAGCQVQTARQRQDAAVDYFVQAQLLRDADDDAAALAALLRAIEADPHLSTAHAAIGDIRHSQGDIQGAVRAYERAVEVNAWNFRNHYNCAALHQALATATKAADAVRRHLERAIELYTRATVLNEKDYDSRLNLGVCHFQLQQYDLAQEWSRQAIELDDSLPHAYTNLGAALDRLGRNYDAIEMYNKSLERDGRQPRVLMNLGEAYRRIGKLESAIRSYQQALELAPGSPEALERLGYCHFFNGDYEASAEYYRAAIAADARMAVAHRGIGIVYMTQFLQNRDASDLRTEALDHWGISLELDPDQPSLADLAAKYRAP